MKDVARVELGAQNYTIDGRLNGRPATVIAVYQLPGTNALATVARAKALMEEMKARFPDDLEYVVSLDTTLAVTAGIQEIVKTLFEALALVILVVFIFLQGVRATLIPLLAVPVSLVGTFAIFPLLGFSINTLSLFGLVLAIGLVVDDAIVVVEAVEHHIEKGLSPRDATLKAMEEVSGPVVAIALILVAVFVPTAFIPGITGRHVPAVRGDDRGLGDPLRLQRADAQPGARRADAAPKKPMRGPLGRLLPGVQRWFGRATDGYVRWSHLLIRRLPLHDARARLHDRRRAASPARSCRRASFRTRTRATLSQRPAPAASSMQRTAAVTDKVDAILEDVPGVEYYTGVVGFSLLSSVFTTYNAFYFIALEALGRALAAGANARASCSTSSGASRSCPRPRRSSSRRRQSPASGRRAASRSCSRTARARTFSSSRRRRASSWRRRRSARSSSW